MPDKYYEINFDGLPGPTHLFSGLAQGNLASETNEGQRSRPKAAALQSLEKIKFLAQLGIREAIIPPQIRPDLEAIKALGYEGPRADVLKKIYEQNPKLFKSIFSSAFMWTANAGTVSPSLDAKDSKLHITTANLQTNFHRLIEAQNTFKYFRQVFATNDFRLHTPLRSAMADEGAANHIRFCEDYGTPGLEFFVYGYSNTKTLESLPNKHPARQSLEAFQEIIKSHELNPEAIVFAQQLPEAIDAGVFHNDVISTGNKNLFFYHEKSFVTQNQVLEELKNKYKKITSKDLILLEAKDSEISLKDAVESYIFNSQILSPDHSEQMLLLCPLECKENLRVKNFIDSKIIHNPRIPIKDVYYLDLKESMRNGGGPACLRLRVVMSEKQIQNCKQSVFYNEALYNKMKTWINKFYPEELSLEMLLDEAFLIHLDQAYAELAKIFDIKLSF